MNKLSDRICWGFLLTGIAALLYGILNFMINHVICIWDEVVYAHNAVSMSENHQWLNYYFFDQVNHYNSKPPLVIWLQVISLAVFGQHEMALRLPTFLALTGIILIYYYWLKKLHIPIIVATLSAFILLTTAGAIRYHVFLTGDLDGVLLFFTTLALLYLIYILEQDRLSNNSVYALGFIFLLGYFAKSTAIFLILPSMLVVVVVYGKSMTVLKNQSLYLSLFLCCIILGSYYVIREQFNPGHFATVIESEYKRLYKVVMTWHEQPFYFYIQNIIQRENRFYAVLSMVALPIYFSVPKLKYKKMVFSLLLALGVYLVFISIPTVKLEWYVAPIYPWWAMLLAMVLYSFYEPIRGKNNYLAQLLLMAVCSYPLYQNILNLHQQIGNVDYYEKEAEVMKSFSHTTNYHHLSVYMANQQHDEVAYLYKKWLEKKKEVQIELIHQINLTQVGDTLLVSDPLLLDSLNSRYTCRPIFESIHGKVLALESK